MIEILGYLSALLIGISLGLIGGGGSILTIPILVYLFKINPEKATSYSLFIVGTTAMIGTVRHYTLGNLKIKSAIYFAIPSLFSMLLVRKVLLSKIPEKLIEINHFEVTKSLLIMVSLALLMIGASIAMIRKTKVKSTPTKINFTRLAWIGFLVGFITGFLGAGGGFLIIPALLFFADLPMKQAVGTSLFIIFINSSIGFIGDVLKGVSINYELLYILTGIAIIGMLLGTHFSKKIDGAKLKPAFGWFVLVMSFLILFKEFLS